MIEHFADADIVARTLYGEARREVAKVGVIGLEAVASVTFNRWRILPQRFGHTPREVCLKPYQFSCWNQNDPNRIHLENANLNDDLYYICHSVANQYLAGVGKDIVNGADHYHAVWISPPSWAKGRKHIVDIGCHRFYRLITKDFIE